MLAMSRALVTAGHDAILVTGRHPDCPDEEERDGVRILREYDQGECGSPRVMQRVLDLARSFDADIIEGADHLGECAGLLAVRDRPPVVIKAHGALPLKALRRAQVLHPWQHITVGVACLRAWKRIRAERMCLEQADLLLAPTQEMLDLLRASGLSLPTQVGTVPNPMAPALPAGGEEESETPTLLMAGRISYLKGVQHLRPLLERVSAEFPSVRLQLAGSDTYARWIGSVRSWLERDLGGLRDRVDFLGVLNPEEMDAAYRRAWVVILPSEFDNFPNVILEAMARQCAVVGSPVGGVAEMLSGTGNLVAAPGQPQFAAAVNALLGDPGARREAGQAGQRKVTSRYAPQTVAREYVASVEACLSS